MNGHRPDVPIIGQQQRVVIGDHRIIAPNSVEVVPNGLSMGDSVAHLRIVDPLKGKGIYVPLTSPQVRGLVMELARVLGIEDIHINQEG